MNMPTWDGPRFSDDDIADTMRTVEPHDFERIAPPAQVWNSILAELEVEIANQEASARRQSRKWFTPGRILAAAAATIVLLGLAVGLAGWGDGDNAPATVEIAEAMLVTDGLPVSTTATADAHFICDVADRESCYLDVELTALPESGTEALELWVINGDVTDMYSLGTITEPSGRFPLPAGVTATDFPIVDISLEPLDGDPTHSGQSVLRGQLEPGE